MHPVSGQVILPTEYPDYSKQSYWNARYTEERGQTFDWYMPWRVLKDVVLPRLYDDKEAEILVIGCGNSGKLKNSSSHMQRSVPNFTRKGTTT